MGTKPKSGTRKDVKSGLGTSGEEAGLRLDARADNGSPADAELAVRFVGQGMDVYAQREKWKSDL